MVVKRGGLGRNLSALLSHTEIKLSEADTPHSRKLAIHSLQPGKYQPRREIEESTLAELSESIKKQGLLQPIVVRPVAHERYEIIAGERRWRACQLAGMQEIPVIVREVDDETAMAMALIENIQREDLNALDQARAMHRLTTDFALTHQQVADLICKSRTAVSNYLRLLNLNEHVKRLLENGDLDMGHARCLLVLDDDQQSKVAQLIVLKNLSVRETESLVARVKNGSPAKQSRGLETDIKTRFQEALHSLSQHLETRVQLKQGKSGKGTIVIHYNDLQTLERMMALLVSQS
ncbi:ParB/RepB/Spo0J family partition protein [Legionella londiniensis]|uniref:Probable chromosome-partitioning protein ParB n=1 Tax=Legionella londiniensis TaxID=45068 RepID=A0A0W0VHI9_9GAMM|nr:ParB/RepB/Spo0J family partition protein [Legionella londiniensis]KTD19546.1 chromosome partitioning protein ParB [Legionella londiniensis]STX92233.1 chromosome partitioning protein ParB [Legionella londiniensis]